MAEKEGITVVFQGDTEQAENSISALNKSLGSLKKEFMDLNKKTKIDPKNFKDIKKALQNLEKQQEAVNGKIELYQKRLDELKSNNEVGSDEWKKLEKEINKCKEQTEWLNNKIEEFRKKDLAPINQQFVKMGDKLESTGKKIEKVGNKLVGVSAVATGALVASAGAVIEFEDSFSGVEKTVDATDEQIRELAQGIRQMALEIPATTTEINAVAESAGQLGIKTEDILNFSKVMIGLGESTNLTSEEASAMIAQFSNITGLDGEYEQLASTLVALGNNGASTEKDIMSLAQRLAGAGATAGLSNQEILALSSAMANVGINAEAGGSSMSTFITKIEGAVAQGGTALSNFAQVAGLSASEFSTMWESEPAKAIDTFVTGLKKVEDEGGSAILTLEGLGISEIRQRDMLLRLSNAQGEITKNIDLANQAWIDNTALADETAKKYDNQKSKLQMMKNAIQEVAIQVGESLSPMIDKCVELVRNFATTIGNMSPSVIQFITVITGLLAVLAPLLIIGGKIATVVGQLATTIGAQGASTGLLASISALALPVTLLAGTLLLAWQQSETFRKACVDLWNVIITSLQPIFESLKATVDKVWQTIQNYAIPIFRRIGDLIGTYLVPTITTLYDWFSAWLYPIIVALSDFMGSFLSASIKVTTTLFNILISVIDVLFGWFKKTFKFLEDLGVWETFGEVLGWVSEIVSTLVSWFSSLFDWVGKCADKVGEFFGKWGDKLGEIGSAVGNFVGGWFRSDGFGDLAFQSGGYTNNITLKTNFNITTNQTITREDTTRWSEEMIDVINEKLGELI